MKKIMFFIVITIITFCTETAFAQEGSKVRIKYIPEKVEILPGVFEFFGTISSEEGSPKGDSYALSMNEILISEILDSVKKGHEAELFGPKLEELVKEKIFQDYKMKRFGIEDKIKKSIASATSFKEKKKLKKELKIEKKNTKNYLMQLQKITERYAVRCIYIYGHKTLVMTSDEEEYLNTRYKDNVPLQEQQKSEYKTTNDLERKDSFYNSSKNNNQLEKEDVDSLPTGGVKSFNKIIINGDD